MLSGQFAREDKLGFRFQKRISLLPGVRINLSKSGVSTSIGPRGADVNIGKDGVTANAGIPGTGLSYRQKLGGASARAGATTKRAGAHGALAILLVIGGLIVWGVQHLGKIAESVAPLHQAGDSSTVLSTHPSTDSLTRSSTGSSTGRAVSSTEVPATLPAPANTSGNMRLFVHRQNAILREKPKASGHILKREMKGAAVTLVSEGADGWSKVMDGGVAGYMRSGVLGTDPTKP